MHFCPMWTSEGYPENIFKAIYYICSDHADYSETIGAFAHISGNLIGRLAPCSFLLLWCVHGVLDCLCFAMITSATRKASESHVGAVRNFPSAI